MLRPAIYSLLFLIVAPGTNAGLIPWVITRWDRPDGDLGPLDLIGALLVLLGLAAVAACFVRFVREGRGTPAPVAPTEKLVVGGLYRYVRNPMYVAVASVIAGQAVLFRSEGTALWLLVFVAAVVAFAKGFEEPQLTEQFGEAYERYRTEVPGWWPRLTPYRT